MLTIKPVWLVGSIPAQSLTLSVFEQPWSTIIFDVSGIYATTVSSVFIVLNMNTIS